jgi:protein-S-isoprenylcysteine O-methyltransferase Ste14
VFKFAVAGALFTIALSLLGLSGIAAPGATKSSNMPLIIALSAILPSLLGFWTLWTVWKQADEAEKAYLASMRKHIELMDEQLGRMREGPV